MNVQSKNVTFKCDSGAQINVLSLKDLKTIVDDENPKWSETKIILEVYGGTQIKPIGKRVLNIYKNGHYYKTEFIIVDKNVRPILGLPSLIELKLLNTCTNNNSINMIKTSVKDVKNELIEKHCELFQGIGQFKTPLQLRVQPGVEHVVRPPRRVPNALMTRLADKLEALVKHKVIAKVEHPKNFVSNLVIIEKKDGSLRICLDPKDLNKVLIREHHLIPTIDEIVSKICNKKWFSVLDLSDGFYNIKITEDSNDLCTFNSPFGCYKFLRMPFGLSTAPEIFQRYSETAFGDIPGVIVYCDDLLICGDTEEEHDAVLEKVFERAKKHNVRFNKNKFQYKLKEVKYFGHIFSEQGMKIDPERINAIINMKSPNNKKELQMFLGMVNYLRKFIPNMANIASPLQMLLKNDVDWLWTEFHESVYKNIKKKLTEAPVLQNFNIKLPICIQCDASANGLGCCLLQNNKPVCFASRSLTPSERNFSQIEKELLSVVWATRKFHYYIYGHKVTIINDHKPLESLLKKHLHEIPSPRLQRLKLKLLKYNIEFKYMQGKLMFIADLLSRSYQECNNVDETYMYEVIHSVGLAKYLECTDEQKCQLIDESSKDEELIKLRDFTQNGWPEKNKIPDSLHSFHKLKNELSVDGQLIFFKDRLVIPKSLRLSFIKTLHEGHIGMSKMKHLARKLYYWPYMDQHIGEFVKKCFSCQTYQNNNVKEPLLSHDIPNLPFLKLGIDILEFKKKNYLVIYDYYSKWLDIKFIANKTAKSIINSLIEIFCNFGIPSEIISDHVPFDSRECKQFAQEWGFKFTYTSPRYPQSNGMAERGVQIAKKMLLKCQEDNTDYRLALLQYRVSPVSGTNFSPCELLMNRNLKTRLVVNSQYLQPKLNSDVKKQFDKIGKRNTRNYNKTSRVRRDFYVNQRVWFKKNVYNNRWLEGEIVQCLGYRSYIVKDNNNVHYTRTSFHIKPA